MTTYEIITIPGNDIVADTKYVQRTDDNGQVWSIPMDESNSDYQAYLATLAANSAPTAQ